MNIRPTKIFSGILVAAAFVLAIACGAAPEPSNDTTVSSSVKSDAILNSPMPTNPPTPTSPPTPSQLNDEQTAELLEEMYWIHVDSIGQSLDVPEINRDLEFQEAQAFVTEFLFNFYDGGLSEIESYGIEPFSTWPYCINAISGAVHQVGLDLAESPSEAAPHIMAIMEIIDMIHQEISSAREGDGHPNKQKCDEFELEKRELMHRTSGQ